MTEISASDGDMDLCDRIADRFSVNLPLHYLLDINPEDVLRNRGNLRFVL
jgi:hypothetical protein